jgi:hypothetical protein
MPLAPDVLERRLLSFVAEADPKYASMVAQWLDEGAAERGLFSLKGPVLPHTVHTLRNALQAPQPDRENIQRLYTSLQEILEGRRAALTRAVAVGCGCLHT